MKPVGIATLDWHNKKSYEINLRILNSRKETKKGK